MAALSRIGSVAARIMSSDTSTSASPIRIRPVWRVLDCSPFRNNTTPTSSNSGTSHVARTSRICVTMAEPRSAPRNIARPTATVSVPLVAKLVTSSATAVELCSRIAASAPVPAAKGGLPEERRNQVRNSVLNARCTPVRMILTDHNSRAAAPARFRIKVSKAAPSVILKCAFLGTGWHVCKQIWRYQAVMLLT